MRLKYLSAFLAASMHVACGAESRTISAQPWVNRLEKWQARFRFSAVALANGDLIVLGGSTNWVAGFRSDVWRSVDQGATWRAEITRNSWSARAGHCAVALASGDVVLLGGNSDAGLVNDVWRSSDWGTTWDKLGDNHSWDARGGHSTVALLNGDLVLLGGRARSGRKRDVWRSSDGGRTWLLVAATALWSAREYQGALVLSNGNIIVLGGQTENGFANDVWRSDDAGATWRSVTTDAQWAARAGHVAVTLGNGLLVLIGGQTASSSGYEKDVWHSSDDGATWHSANPSVPWDARAFHGTVALSNGDLVLLGGWTEVGPDNEVWRSQDAGASWRSTKTTAPWTARSGHKVVALSSGDLILLGGVTAFTLENDVWRSRDMGATWHSVLTSPLWTPRQGHSIVVLANSDILLLGGNTSSHLANDVWRCSDVGVTWHVVITNAAWDARTGHSTASLADGEIILTGGERDSGQSNDVWRSSDGGVTWDLVSETAAWSARAFHSTVVVSSGDLVMCGGGITADVWRSNDKGRNWQRVGGAVPWRNRWRHSSFVLPNGDIVLAGGGDEFLNFNDVWRSSDEGTTWRRWDTPVAWDPRRDHSMVAFANGAVVLLGGYNGSSYRNDVWRSSDQGASWQNVRAPTTPERAVAAAGHGASGAPPHGGSMASHHSPLANSAATTTTAACTACEADSDQRFASSSIAVCTGSCAPALSWSQINVTPIRNAAKVVIASLGDDRVLQLRFPVKGTSVVIIAALRGMYGLETIDTAWTQVAHHTLPDADMPIDLVDAAATGMRMGAKGSGLLLCGGQYPSASGAMLALSRCWWMREADTSRTCEECGWAPRHSMQLAAWSRLLGTSASGATSDLALLFGGVSANGVYFSDLWISAAGAGTWVQVQSTAPLLPLRAPIFGVVESPLAKGPCTSSARGAQQAAIRVLIAGGLRPGTFISTPSLTTLLDVCVSLVQGSATVVNTTSIRTDGQNSTHGLVPPATFDAVALALPGGIACAVGGKRAFDESHDAPLHPLTCTADGETWHVLDSTPSTTDGHLRTASGFSAAFVPDSHEVLLLGGSGNYCNSTLVVGLVTVDPWIGRTTEVTLSTLHRPVLVRTVTIVCAFRQDVVVASQSVHDRITRTSIAQLEAAHVAKCARGLVRACATSPQWNGTVCSAPTRVQLAVEVLLARALGVVGTDITATFRGVPTPWCTARVHIVVMWIWHSERSDVVPRSTRNASHTTQLQSLCEPLQVPIPLDVVILHPTSAQPIDHALRMLVSTLDDEDDAPILRASVESPPIAVECGPGHYVASGTGKCAACAPDFYQPVSTRNTTCLKCPSMTFALTGATSCKSCVDGQDRTAHACGECEADRYLENGFCISCRSRPDLDCDGQPLASSKTARYWWRSPTSLDRKGDRCLASRNACIGGRVNDSASCSATGGPGCGCAAGHRGALCMSCVFEHDYVRSAWISPGGGVPCQKCASRVAAVAALVGVLALLVLASWMTLSGRCMYTKWATMSSYARWRALHRRPTGTPPSSVFGNQQKSAPLLLRASEREHGPAPELEHAPRVAVAETQALGAVTSSMLVTGSRRRDLWLWMRSSILMVQTVQIGLQYTQVAAASVSVFSLQASDSAPSRLSNVVDTVVGSTLLDVQRSMFWGCAFPFLTHPHGRLLVATLPSLLFCAGAGYMALRAQHPALRGTALWAAVAVATFTSSNAQTKILSSLACRRLSSLGGSYLVNDPDVECSVASSQFWALAALAAVMAACFCVLYPLLMYKALRAAARRGQMPVWLQPAVTGMHTRQCVLEVLLPLQRMVSTALFVFLSISVTDQSPSATGAMLCGLLHMAVQAALVSLSPFRSPKAQRAFIVAQSTVALCAMQLAALPRMSEHEWFMTPSGVHVVLLIGVALLAVVIFMSPSEVQDYANRAVTETPYVQTPRPPQQPTMRTQQLATL